MSNIANRSGILMAEEQDVERVLELAGSLPAPRAWPALVVLVGPPGAGKTTLCRSLCERMPVVVLDEEAIRYALAGIPDYSFGESQRVSRAIRAATAALLSRSATVVIDAPNLTEWERQPLYSLAEGKHARLVVVQVSSPIHVVLERIRRLAREERADERLVEIYERMAGRQEPITRPHLTVDCSNDITQFVEGLVLDLEEG
jgi:predicted kinase